MIIITGASGEIGTYLTGRFLEEGERVIALDKVKNKYEEFINFKFEEIDISKGNELDALWDRLSIPTEATLLNLVGNISTDPLVEIFKNGESENFYNVLKQSFEDNYFPIAQATMSFARFAIENNLDAQVINFGSISSEGIFGQIPYGSSKGAVQSFSRVASIELGAFGVRVNCIVPGYVDSPGLYKRITKERLKEIIKMSTVGKLVDLNDIFIATKFLVDSKTVNGQFVEVHSIHGR
jgi:NAD(P)-dependent dehydrogenase (short-subunit alcohol dehydrogenase family)